LALNNNHPLTKDIYTIFTSIIGDVLLFVVSRKSSEEPFAKIEDMNARTSILPDFIVPD